MPVFPRTHGHTRVSASAPSTQWMRRQRKYNFALRTQQHQHSARILSAHHTSPPAARPPTSRHFRRPLPLFRSTPIRAARADHHHTCSEEHGGHASLFSFTRFRSSISSNCFLLNHAGCAHEGKRERGAGAEGEGKGAHVRRTRHPWLLSSAVARMLNRMGRSDGYVLAGHEFREL